MRIGGNAAKSVSLAPGELKDDQFRADRVEEILGLLRFRQYQFTSASDVCPLRSDVPCQEQRSVKGH
jgi:hypothetical protein